MFAFSRRSERERAGLIDWERNVNEKTTPNFCLWNLVIIYNNKRWRRFCSTRARPVTPCSRRKTWIGSGIRRNPWRKPSSTFSSSLSSSSSPILSLGPPNFFFRCERGQILFVSPLFLFGYIITFTHRAYLLNFYYFLQ